MLMGWWVADMKLNSLFIKFFFLQKQWNPKHIPIAVQVCAECGPDFAGHSHITYAAFDKVTVNFGQYGYTLRAVSSSCRCIFHNTLILIYCIVKIKAFSSRKFLFTVFSQKV